MPRIRQIPKRSKPAVKENHLSHYVPPHSVTIHQQPKQSGMFAQMATTAAGVAIGSAVGHTVGAALTNGLSSSSNLQNAQDKPIKPNYEQSKYDFKQGDQTNPCQNNIDDLLRCTQRENDIGLCMGFNEALKDCKRLFRME